MRRPHHPRAPWARLSIVALTAAAATLSVLPASAQDASPAPMAESPAPMAESPAPMAESPAPMAESPAAMAAERVDLPPGWRPEGVASLGDQVFVGSLADGAIYRIDAATREGEVFVPGVEGAVAVGIEADEPNGRIWVAGGDTGEVRVYAADSGDLLETYTFEGGFLNDLAFTGSAVVATDSNVAQLIVIPLGPDGALPTPRAVGTVPVTGDLVYEEGDFGGANGIVATADPAVAIVIQSATGGLFTIDPLGGVTTAIETGGADLTAGDGMYLDGSTLYVSRNQANTITTLELDETLSSASLVSEATSEGLDIPSTLSLAGDDLWIVNARFGTEPTPETEYWLSIWPGAQQPAA